MFRIIVQACIDSQAVYLVGMTVLPRTLPLCRLICTRASSAERGRQLWGRESTHTLGPSAADSPGKTPWYTPCMQRASSSELLQ